MPDQRENITDAQLLESLFLQYRDKMYAIAFSILHEQYQAEDAVGDAFEKLIPYLGKCHDIESQKTKALLTRFVKNAAIDIYRKNRRETGNISVEEQEWLEDPYRPIEAYMKSLQHQEVIQKIKEILPRHYWDVVCMKYFEGMPVGEIARRLDLSEENVYTRLRRAKEKVRLLMGDESYEDS